MTGTWTDRPRHSYAECARFLDGFLIEPERLLRELGPARRAGPANEVTIQTEAVELLGAALWDVFSDNHTVVDAGGTAYDLGSFRASAGFIAESINRRYEHLPRPVGYLDFYMGTRLAPGDSARPRVYRWIFGRLDEAGCRWDYSFPRMYLIDLGGTAAAEGEPWGPDPSEAVRRDIDQDEHPSEIGELREQMERAYEEDLRAARHRPLPETVAAYRDVFGALPEGWPHPDM